MSGFMPEIPRSALFNEDNLIWMDLEMTGLEPQVNRILEMAAVITDPQLNVIAEGPVVVIHQTPQVLNAMDSWNTSHHTKSGLVRKSLESEIDEAQAADIYYRFFLSVCFSKEEPSVRQFHRARQKIHGSLDAES